MAAGPSPFIRVFVLNGSHELPSVGFLEKKGPKIQEKKDASAAQARLLARRFS